VPDIHLPSDRCSRYNAREEFSAPSEPCPRGEETTLVPLVDEHS
jgi:hypothetical protein